MRVLIRTGRRVRSASRRPPSVRVQASPVWVWLGATGRGFPWRGQVRRGTAGRRKPSQVKAGLSMTRHGVAGLGSARRGKALQDTAWLVPAWLAWLVPAWLGRAGLGTARLSRTRRGTAGSGEARLGWAGRDSARQGFPGPGAARQGPARHVRANYRRDGRTCRPFQRPTIMVRIQPPRARNLLPGSSGGRPSVRPSTPPVSPRTGGLVVQGDNHVGTGQW
jgi:hypothetical protein